MSVRLVVADTGPINYLVWIAAVEILPQLFERVIIPQAVHDELRRPATPAAIRDWAENPPAWLDVCENPVADLLPPKPHLDDGERAAIALALAIHTDLVLMDDRDGVAVAVALGLQTIGTLGVLGRAARLGLIDLATAFDRLKQTSFRFSPEIMENLLVQYGGNQR